MLQRSGEIGLFTSQGATGLMKMGGGGTLPSSGTAAGGSGAGLDCKDSSGCNGTIQAAGTVGVGR